MKDQFEVNETPKERPLGIEIIRIFLKRWKIIIALTAVAMLSSLVFTAPYFIQPQYKSETTIYPPTSNTSTGLLNSDMHFGSESDINNEIQILHSSMLRDSMIRKFNLYKHYGIDTTSIRKVYDINKIYNENISVDQSRYNSIVITVYDHVPETAAAMANTMVSLADRVKSEIIKKNLRKVFDIVSQELNNKVADISHLADSINLLREENYREAIALKNEHFLSEKNYVNDLRNSLMNIRTHEEIYDLDKQYNSLYETWLAADAKSLVDSQMVAVMVRHYEPDDTALVRIEAELAGATALSKKVRDKLNNLNLKGKQYNDLMDNYNFERGILGGLKSDYETATSSYEKEFPNLHLETLKNKYTAELQLYNNLKARYELAFNNLTDLVPSSYVVSPAEVTSQKVFPKRRIITLLAGTGIFMLCIACFLLAARIPDIASLIRD